MGDQAAMTGCAAAADSRLKAGQGVRVARGRLAVGVPLLFLLKFSSVSSVIMMQTVGRGLGIRQTKVQIQIPFLLTK